VLPIEIPMPADCVGDALAESVLVGESMPDAPNESPPEESAGPFSDLAPPVRQALIARGFPI
jgi:hypothetical protein